LHTRRWLTNASNAALCRVPRLKSTHAADALTGPATPVLSTETSCIGSVLGKVPVRFSRNKRHNYMVFGSMLAPPTNRGKLALS